MGPWIMPVMQVISMVVFTLVAFVAATMAAKGLSSQGLLPFHQAASGRAADSLTPSETSVAVALTRSLGLGFAAAALSLFAAVAAEAVRERWAMVTGAGVALVFCCGLAVVNRQLARATSVGTPWKGSAYAAAMVAIGLVLGMV